jgi:hypothetical protein
VVERTHLFCIRFKIVLGWSFTCEQIENCVTLGGLIGSAGLHFFPIHLALIESVVSFKKFS